MSQYFRFCLLCVGILSGLESFSKEGFDHFFHGNCLRFDFILAGNHETMTVYPVQVRVEPFWAGSRVNLTDTSGYGTFRYHVTEVVSGRKLFSRGFCTLFQEWQTTAEAKVKEKTFYQALFFPLPKEKVNLCLEQRNRDGDYLPVLSVLIDPADYFILKEKPEDNDTIQILRNGTPENHIDLVFLAEGYGRKDRETFRRDAERMCGALFSVTPFSELRNRFNVTAVWTPSEETGTDLPGEHVYRNTRFNSTFYTFDTDRYLTTSDMKTVYDAAACTPWDQLVVLVNTERYGGGGFYNLVTVCSAGHALTPQVLAHEFGHAFAGLGDEYYESEVSYENYYNLDIEPWESNLTTLKDFGSKWKQLVSEDVPVPTPRTPRYKGVVGAFEGGGYTAGGIFSPMQDCRMKSTTSDQFCQVCQLAIRRMIDWYTAE